MSLLGWGTLALGAYTAYSGAQAQERASDASAAQLAFTQEQYKRYLEVYGSAEENLSEYYNSLTPEQYETAGLDAYDAQFQAAQQQYEQSLAQRGLAGSGVEAEGLMSMDVQGAQARANIQASAPQQWAADQMNWLSLGTGQGAQATTNLANTYGNQVSMYSQQAASAGQGVGSLISGAMYANAYNPGSMDLSLSDLKFW